MLRMLTLLLLSGPLLAQDSATEKARIAAARTKTTTNLKMLGVALHGYINQNARFPADVYSKDGKTVLLSCRVQLLPFLEEEALYKQFKLDEPWDSEHNKPLIAKMPKVLSHPHAKTDAEGNTFFQGFVGEPKHKAQAWLINGDTIGRAIASFSDGLSPTLMLAEAEAAVPWTKPADIAFDPEGKRPKVGNHWPGDLGFLALFGDGSVKLIPHKTGDDKLKALVTVNGGETIEE